MIPNLIKPEKDELMFSYLWRLSFFNGFDNLTDFLKAHFFEKPIIRLDANNIFAAFFKKTGFVDDKVRFYLDHTIYAGIAPLMSRNAQGNYIAHAFCDNEEMWKICGASHSIFNTLNICPDCMEEDLNRVGFWYYHRFHHMPGVSMCAKHKIPLKQRTRTKSGNRAIYILPFKEDFSEVSGSNYDYAVFVKDLLEAEIDTDYTIVSKIEDNHIKRYQQYYKHFKNLMAKHNEQAIIKALNLLFTKYKNIRNLKKDLGTVKEETFDGYEILGKYYRPLLEMRNKDTGERFITTESGFKMGWREPKKSKKASEKFREMFETVSDSTYHLDSDFVNMWQKIRVSHDVCRTTFSITPNAFLINGVRCKCEKSSTEIKSLIAENKWNINYNMQYPCKSFEKVAKGLSEKEYNFHLNIICQEADCFNKHYFTNITNAVYDLVGNEYTVLFHDSEEKITIRHEECGKEFECKGIDFLTGKRCPYCMGRINEINFRQYVKEVSGGLYKIGKNKGNYVYEIINTETKEVKAFKHMYILQELNRPTPSLSIPLAEKHHSEAFMTETDYIWRDIKERHGINDFILSSEYEKLDELVERKEFFYKVYNGTPSIYSFYDMKLTTEQIAELLCIERNGNIFGFYSGDTLLYKLSWINEEPEGITITSNIYEMFKSINDTFIYLQPSYVEITNENYEILKFIDLCYENKKHNYRFTMQLEIYILIKKLLAKEVMIYLSHYPQEIQDAVRYVYDYRENKAQTKKRKRDKR